MPKWQDGDTVVFIIFVFKISLVPNNRVKYYDYMVKWRSGIACNWCVSLDIGLILALNTIQYRSFYGTKIFRKPEICGRSKEAKFGGT